MFQSNEFWPLNRPLKIQESIWDSNSQNGSSLGSVRVHSLTLFCTLRGMRCDSWTSFLARTLVNLYFDYEPKVRVATSTMPLLTYKLWNFAIIVDFANLIFYFFSSATLFLVDNIKFSAPICVYTSFIFFQVIF
jgi:hypothetical protein